MLPVMPGAIGQEGDLRRRIPQSQRIVQGKILQFVWPDDRLGLLARLITCDGARNQFWTELSIQNGAQYLARLGIELIGVGHPADEELDEGSGHTGIDG